MPYRDSVSGGRADKSKPSDFNAKQLAAGIKVEREHTKSQRLAREIAMDHLKEDPRYYVKLKKMEDPRYHSTLKKMHKESWTDFHEVVGLLGDLRTFLMSESASPPPLPGAKRAPGEPPPVPRFRGKGPSKEVRNMMRKVRQMARHTGIEKGLKKSGATVVDAPSAPLPRIKLPGIKTDSLAVLARKVMTG